MTNYHLENIIYQTICLEEKIICLPSSYQPFPILSLTLPMFWLLLSDCWMMTSAWHQLVVGGCEGHVGHRRQKGRHCHLWDRQSDKCLSSILAILRVGMYSDPQNALLSTLHTWSWSKHSWTRWGRLLLGISILIQSESGRAGKLHHSRCPRISRWCLWSWDRRRVEGADGLWSCHLRRSILGICKQRWMPEARMHRKIQILVVRLPSFHLLGHKSMRYQTWRIYRWV